MHSPMDKKMIARIESVSDQFLDDMLKCTSQYTVNNRTTGTKIPGTYDIIKKYTAIFKQINGIAISFCSNDVQTMVQNAAETIEKTAVEEPQGIL